MVESGTVCMLNLATEKSSNFWLTLTFIILVRKLYMTSIIKYCMASFNLLERSPYKAYGFLMTALGK